MAAADFKIQEILGNKRGENSYLTKRLTPVFDTQNYHYCLGHQLFFL